ncbi:MAG: N-acetylmuramoyl-L-alanine amidase, partial [Bacteroidota bacterium]
KTICIHVDSRSKSQQTDLFFYYAPGSNSSKKFANQLHQTMKAKYAKYRKSGSYRGTVTPRDLHMLRETIPTSVYIELGNIRNSFDQLRIVPESNRQALANWLSEGIRR